VVMQYFQQQDCECNFMVMKEHGALWHTGMRYIRLGI